MDKETEVQRSWLVRKTLKTERLILLPVQLISLILPFLHRNNMPGTRGENTRDLYFFLQNSKDSEMWCHIEDFLRTFQVSVIIPLLTHRRYHRSSYWVDSVHFPRGMKDKKEFEKLPLTRKQLDESWREIRLISEILKIANVQSFYSIKSGFRIQGLKWNPHDQLGFNPFYPLMFYTPIVIISDT